MLNKIILSYEEDSDEMPYCLKEGKIIINRENNRIQGLLCKGDSCEYLYGVLLKNGILEFTVIASNGRLYDFQLQLNNDQEYYGTCKKINYEGKKLNKGKKVNAKIKTTEYSILDYEKIKEEIKSIRESLNSKQVEVIRRLFLGYCGTLEKVFKWEREEETSFSKK